MAVLSFDYIKPQTLEQLLEGLRESRLEGAVLAGGTDLHVKIRSGRACPRVLFDISELAPCRGIVDQGDCLRIGAAVTMAEIMASATVRRLAPSLAVAAGLMSSRQIRNRASLGGNIITASPAADAVPPLMAADAMLGLVGPDGRREVQLAEFLTGPGQTALRCGEVLTEVLVPTRRPNCREHFLKVGRRKALAISIVNVAGRIDVDRDGFVRDVRIVLGAVAPTAMRARQAERALTGALPNARNLAEAAAMAAEECHPISDVRATGNGRRLLIEAWTLRLLQGLCEKMGEKSGGLKP